MVLDVVKIRSQFPALHPPEKPVPPVFFDNPGGTQVAQSVLDRINNYLVKSNANHGGAFETSQVSDTILDEAHAAMADMLNARRPEEIIFGNNMTTLTFHISRSLARSWKEGDTIVVTHLDHDANISPWVLAAKDRGCKVHWVGFHQEDGTLDMQAMEAAMDLKPRLVAVGYASNALGTINPVKKITQMAHAVGAQVYIDAVQYVPHGTVDVQDLDCDFLVCSSYKFFGPHAGILYGKYDLLEELFAYKVRPAPNDLPHRFETGTQNHEGLAGVLGAVEYLEWVGETFGSVYAEKFSDRFSGRKLRLKQGLTAIRAYEFDISRAILDVLQETPGLQLYGIGDARRVEERVPTFSFTLRGWAPRQAAERLAKEDIYVWDGNYYALAVTERLGLEESGGMIRVGPVHYNTLEEIDRLRRVLGQMVTG